VLPSLETTASWINAVRVKHASASSPAVALLFLYTLPHISTTSLLKHVKNTPGLGEGLKVSVAGS
jgi:hypothetical protein